MTSANCGHDVLLLNLNNLETSRNQPLATLMFKGSNSIVSHCISNLFQRTADVHNYETRRVQNYFLPKPNNQEKNHLVAGVQWLGIVYLVILEDLKLSSLSKISFNWNESNHNFLL